MGKTCGECMYLSDQSKKGALGITTYWCKGFGVWRRSGQAACNAFVQDNSMCYLTSACVTHRGLSDDCEELTLLRYFRDNYMKHLEGGPELIAEYYAIAPKIIEAIEKRADRNEIYNDIYQTVLKCVSLIKQKNYPSTLLLYQNMTLALKVLLLS